MFGSIVASDFPLGNVGELRADHLLAYGGNPVGIDRAEKMVEFMLYDPGCETGEFLFMLFEVFVEPVESDVFMSLHVFRDSWNG